MARLLMPFRLMAPVATTSSCRRASSGWTSTSMLSEYSRVKCGIRFPFLFHGRCAVLMERLDGLQSPCLSLLPFCLTPHNWLPIRREDEARTCVGNFKTIAARFIHVQEERLLDGMFMRTRFDENPVFQTNIRCA